MADLAVTPYPFPEWRYAAPTALPGAAADPEVDGIRFACGADDAVAWDGPGCGEPFYLSFVRFEDGRRVDPDRVPERVDLAADSPISPSAPGDSGPAP